MAELLSIHQMIVVFIWPTVMALAPDKGQAPVAKTMLSTAMSPASPPTEASRTIWWTSCVTTWRCSTFHRSPWDCVLCHTCSPISNTRQRSKDGVKMVRQQMKGVRGPMSLFADSPEFLLQSQCSLQKPLEDPQLLQTCGTTLWDSTHADQQGEPKENLTGPYPLPCLGVSSPDTNSNLRVRYRYVNILVYYGIDTSLQANAPAEKLSAKS